MPFSLFLEIDLSVEVRVFVSPHEVIGINQILSDAFAGVEGFMVDALAFLVVDFDVPVGKERKFQFFA